MGQPGDIRAMSGQESVDTERAVVTTYVPAYQKSAWEEHADDLGMSQSEFVRSMVQAGRRGFGGITYDDMRSEETDSSASSDQNPDAPVRTEKPRSVGTDPGGSMRETVLQTLERDGPLSWEELVEAVIGDIEGDLEDAIIQLDDENRIRHRPRDGKYILVED